MTFYRNQTSTDCNIMRKLCFTLTLFIGFSCGESTSSDPAEKYAPERGTGTTAEVSMISADSSHSLKNMEDIKREYANLTSALQSNNIDSVSFSYNCYDEKKGKVIYFSDGDGLRLLRHTYNEYSHFSGTDEYFVKDDSLFFVFYDHVSWSFTGEGETKDNVTENRFYIIDGKPIKCLEKKFTIRSSSSGNMQPQAAENKETDCSSFDDVTDKFGLLLKYRNRESDLTCLEK